MSDAQRGLVSEGVNERTLGIDRLPLPEILERIHQEDRGVATAVGLVIPEVVRAVERIVEAFDSGGRLLYVGAGTSGRLGVLDASEIPPTFGFPPERVEGIVAGGSEALLRAIEGAEDDVACGAQELIAREVGPDDVVVGITASGCTPFVLGALQEAGRRGSTRVLLTVNPVEEKVMPAEVIIAPIVGPEVIAGSTRMKAGTATKMILNMLTTAAMIRLGKVHGNRMVDLTPTNEKLVRRALGLLCLETGCEQETARELLDRSGGNVKTAIVMHQQNCSAEEARGRLEAAGGFLHRVLS